MAVVLDRETEQEVEAVLNAMESAVPASRAEYLGGSYTLNRPRTNHQYTQIEVAIAIRQILPEGLSVVTEPRVHQVDDEGWIVPDIVVAPTELLTQDLAIVDPAEIVLIAEVLSPSTTAKDRGPKREFCERFEIDYWAVELGRPWGTIEVFDFGHRGLTPPPTPSGTAEATD